MPEMQERKDRTPDRQTCCSHGQSLYAEYIKTTKTQRTQRHKDFYSDLCVLCVFVVFLFLFALFTYQEQYQRHQPEHDYSEEVRYTVFRIVEPAQEGAQIDLCVIIERS